MARRLILGLALASILPACGGGGGGGGVVVSISGLADAAFSPGGRLVVGDHFDGSVHAVALQPDGKLVAVGTRRIDGWQQVAVVRVLPDGSLDDTFGSGGVAAPMFAGTYNSPTCVVLQSDGKIVIGGDSSSGAAVYRLTATGLPDTTFDSDGMSGVSFPGGSQVHAIALQSDGKILIAGIGGFDIGVARFAANGAVDSTFDTDGMLTTGFPGAPNSAANAVMVQADGKIVVAGYATPGGSRVLALVRYNADGSLDVAFDGDGRAIGIFGTRSWANTAVLQPDGKILVAGSVVPGGADEDILLARFTSAGGVDTAFASAGALFTALGPDDDEALTMLVYPDGRILAGGLRQDAAGKPDLGLIRYTAAGALDPSFGTGGTLIRSVSAEEDHVTSLALQNDGRILVGLRVYAGQDEFSLLRLNVDGSPDPTFHPGGTVVRPLADSQTLGRALAVQAGGKILVAGSAKNAGFGSDFTLTRFLPDGSIDSAFGGGGTVWQSIQAGDDAANAMVLQSDGKILVAGRTHSGNMADPQLLAIVRFNANGSIDGTFGTSGISVTAGGQDILDLAVQPDGKILAAVSDGNFAVYRYLSDGTLDATFGTNGRATAIPPSSAGSLGRALALQSDGKIVVVGSRTFGINSYLTACRLLADGTLDATFGSSGFVDAGSGGWDFWGNDVLIQPDGKIVIGATDSANGPSQAVLLRYHPDGAPDATFDGDGKLVLDIPGANETAVRIDLQPDGKIIMVGICSPSVSDHLIVRVNPDGSLDGGFGTGGMTIIDQAFSYEVVHALAVQPDGSILVLGDGANLGPNFLILTRIHP